MPGLVLRQIAGVAEAELGVARGRLAPLRDPRVELGQEDPQDGGLQLVEARVVAEQLEVDLVAGAVEAEHAHALRELRIVRGDETPVAEREQVLRRVEAERRRNAGAGNLRRAEGLRRVLDHRDAELRELGGGRRPAEQVHRDDRLRPRADARRNLLDVEVHRHRIDVGEDRRRTAAGNRLGRRVEGEGGADHLVARPDAERVEDEHEGVRAVGDADRLTGAEIVGSLALERGDVGAEDEIRARQDAVDRLADARQQRLVLRLYVNERDRTHGSQV
jgi:hypothetical protein